MADRYWVGGSGTWDSSSTTNWSTTSGGAGGASVPTSADNVIFDSNSGGSSNTEIVTISGAVTCANLTVTGSFAAPWRGTGATLNIHGTNVTVPENNWANSSLGGSEDAWSVDDVVFHNSGTITLNSGADLYSNVEISGGGTLASSDNDAIKGDLSIINSSAYQMAFATTVEGETFIESGSTFTDDGSAGFLKTNKFNCQGAWSATTAGVVIEDFQNGTATGFIGGGQSYRYVNFTDTVNSTKTLAFDGSSFTETSSASISINTPGTVLFTTGNTNTLNLSDFLTISGGGTITYSGATNLTLNLLEFRNASTGASDISFTGTMTWDFGESFQDALNNSLSVFNCPNVTIRTEGLASNSSNFEFGSGSVIKQLDVYGASASPGILLWVYPQTGSMTIGTLNVTKNTDSTEAARLYFSDLSTFNISSITSLSGKTTSERTLIGEISRFGGSGLTPGNFIINYTGSGKQIYNYLDFDNATLQPSRYTWYAGYSVKDANTTGVKTVFDEIAPIRYWVGGSGSWNLTSTTNWSTTSGGSSGAPAPDGDPGSIIDVYFDSNSGNSSSVIDFDLGFSETINIGSFIVEDSFSGTIDFAGTGSSNAFTVSDIFLGTNVNVITSTSIAEIGVIQTTWDDYSEISITPTLPENLDLTVNGPSGTNFHLLKDLTLHESLILNDNFFPKGNDITVIRVEGRQFQDNAISIGSGYDDEGLSTTLTANYISCGLSGTSTATNVSVGRELVVGSNISLNNVTMNFDSEFSTAILSGGQLTCNNFTATKNTSVGAAGELEDLNPLSLDASLTVNGTFTIGSNQPGRLLPIKLNALTLQLNGTANVNNSYFYILDGSSKSITGTASPVSGSRISWLDSTDSLISGVTRTTPTTRTAVQNGYTNEAATWGGTVPLPHDSIENGAATQITMGANAGNVFYTCNCDFSTGTSLAGGSDVTDQMVVESPVTFNPSLSTDTAFRINVNTYGGSSSIGLNDSTVGSAIWTVTSFENTSITFSSNSSNSTTSSPYTDLSLFGTNRIRTYGTIKALDVTLDDNIVLEDNMTIEAGTLTLDTSLQLGSDVFFNTNYVGNSFTVANLFNYSSGTVSPPIIFKQNGYSSTNLNTSQSLTLTSLSSHSSVTSVSMEGTFVLNNVNGWNLNGVSEDNLLEITGDHSINLSDTGTIEAQYLTIEGSAVTPSDTWYAIDSTDQGGNSGWIFEDTPTGNGLFWSNF